MYDVLTVRDLAKPLGRFELSQSDPCCHTVDWIEIERKKIMRINHLGLDV